MGEKSLSNKNKWKYTIYTSVCLILIMNKYSFQLSNLILKPLIGKTEINNCPTLLGYIVHIVIFTLAIRYLMDINI